MSDDLPVNQFMWALAAVEGADSTLHVDRDGQSTVITVESEDGGKAWGVGRPRYGLQKTDLTGRMGSSYAFRSQSSGTWWDYATACVELFQWEVIALAPGDTL